MMFCHLTGRGRKGKQIIYSRRHLESAFIAVPHGTFDPFWIAGAPANNAANLFCKGTDDRSFGQRVVIVIDGHITTGQVCHGGRKTARKLVVIVAVQNIMLAIILIVQNSISSCEPRLKDIARGNAISVFTIGIGRPDEEGFSKV